jgi:hypothetical protein
MNTHFLVCVTRPQFIGDQRYGSLSYDTPVVRVAWGDEIQMLACVIVRLFIVHYFVFRDIASISKYRLSQLHFRV